LAAGKYEASSLEYFLKIKTLMDLMVIKPDALSPFAKTLGFPGATNESLLASFINAGDRFELGFDLKKTRSLLKDFRDACTQPSPLFSMVVPVAYMLDLNRLWYNDFYSKELGVEHAREINIPAAFFFSKAYAKNEAEVKTVMSSLSVSGEYKWDDESTVEILLDGDFIAKVLPVAGLMHDGRPALPAAATATAK
jgi:hypothetical protein